MVKLVIVIPLVMLGISGCSYATQGPTVRAVHVSADTVGRFERCELTFELSARYDNPYDPDEIDVGATLLSPSGKAVRIPGFYYEGFTSCLADGAETLERTGDGAWKVRFAPQETGTYTYFVTVKDKTGQTQSPARTLTVRDSLRDGFVRRSTVVPNYLVYDSGKDYFAVGENVAWASERKQIYDYERYFDKLAASGCTYARVWMATWGLAIEWSPSDPNAQGDFGGTGKYSMENAWRLDRVLQMAEDRGIHIVLTLGTYGDLMIEKGYWNEQKWLYNPYNAAQGGPCRTPADMWTDEAAKGLYKKRLRYIVARWGYSQNLLALELWNEVSAPRAWVAEMAEFIKKLDPYGHFVTISLGAPPSAEYRESHIWDLDDIDYTQIHLYGYQGNLRDLIPELSAECFNRTGRYRKPCLVAEFGIDSGKDDRFYDRAGTGVNLHNGLWAAACSGSFGGAMNWWWDQYVEKKDLYPHFNALSKFVKGIQWSKAAWKRLATTPVIQRGAQGASEAAGGSLYSDLVVKSKDEWRRVDVPEYTIRNDGQVIGGTPNKYLHGLPKEDLRVTPVFNVNYPIAGTFAVHIGTVSQGAVISFYVDGVKVVSKEMPAAEHVAGKEGKSEYKKEWDIWWCRYDEDIAVDISPGPHAIRLENTGPDWATIERITLTNYKDNSYLGVRVIGLVREGEAVMWIQNIGHGWYNISRGIEPRTFKDLSFDACELTDGEYTVEWWDTYKGDVARRNTLNVKDGKAHLEIPELATDIACTLKAKSKRTPSNL